MTRTPLPYGRQSISEEDVSAVSDALRAPMITQGPRVEEFERAICEFTGARFAVAFSSGTAALHGAASAAGFGPGDVVLAPVLTFVASANCVLYVGAAPRLVDIDRATWNIDTSVAAEILRSDPGVRGAVVVSFAGLPIEMGALREARGDAVLIEDACHALGGTRAGAPVGGPGGADMTVFSLHPVKAMTSGEGGVVTAEDPDLADRLRRFRTHGIIRELADPDGPWAYDMVDLGFNYRITDFQSALATSQLKRLPAWITRRNELADRYRELLGDDTRLELPPPAPPDAIHAHHIFPVRVEGGAEVRLAVFESLRAAGLGVQVHYIPINRFSFYRDRKGSEGGFPEADRYYAGAITLPLFPGMTDEDVARVVGELDRALEASGAPKSG